MAKPNPRIWTFEVLELLYTRLVAKFGPASEWTNYNDPGRGLLPELEEFCTHFGKAVGARTNKPNTPPYSPVFFVIKIAYYGVPTNGSSDVKGFQPGKGCDVRSIWNLCAASKAGWIDIGSNDFEEET